ncbi:transporter substrate-binding domain-containing protein [Bdellovibrio sp. 22V]|uniref:substrate-binding periplasmic protein n=1 Tax=Bdellovibrio TaxID=958 RepID=UPI0025426D3D|nr:transporter substrate-binding domain-containing protein [Bdellovibrio sp. 22V]WII73574.1 transporter substrate-binding domain-containing protein [Bdellovibrio sp. 22V]
MRFSAILLLCSVFAFSVSGHEAKAPHRQELRGGVPAGLAAPLLFEEKDPTHLVGLVPDYINALAEELGMKSSLSLVTRYRLDDYLLKGQMDMLCYTSTVWASNKDQLDFSIPIFTKREVIIGPAPMPKRYQDLQGKTIGAMLQYVYPKLDPLFAAKKINREDAPREEANLMKLLNGRLSYIVTDEIFLDYFKTKHPEIEKGRERMFLQEYPISCSISRKGRVKVKDLNAAIERLKTNGKLEKIFKKYGSSFK